MIDEHLHDEIHDNIKRISELEKEIKSWRKTFVNQLFTNQVHLKIHRKIKKEIAELREKVKLSVLNEAIINGHTKELKELKEAGSAALTELEKLKKFTFDNWKPETEEKTEGQWDCDDCNHEREGIHCERCYLWNNFEPKVSGGMKSQFVKDVENFQESLDARKPPELIDCDDCKHNYNYAGKHCFDTVGFCNGLENDKFEPKEERLPDATGTEPREDDSWIKDENKPKPLRIDINGIRLGKLVVVKREALKRWAGKLYEAINDQEFVIDEFEELMNEIEGYGIE